jgi:hypothetical protein
MKGKVVDSYNMHQFLDANSTFTDRIAATSVHGNERKEKKMRKVHRQDLEAELAAND